MLTPLQVAETGPQAAAIIHLTIPRESIREFMEAAIAEVLQAVAAQGIGPAGPLFSHHYDMRPGLFNFEVGFPVSGPVSPVGRVKAGVLPGGKVLRTVYTGPYENLGAAWGEFQDLAEAAGHKTADNLWERYLTHPSDNPDPSTWRTELNLPLL